MAYIYEFAFLCASELDAKRLSYYLTDIIMYNTQWPFREKILHTPKFPCLVWTNSHNRLDSDENNGPNTDWWVEVVPRTNDNQHQRWPSGGPANDQEAEEMLQFASYMTNLIENFPSRIKFEFAQAGVEVAGFRNYQEIIELYQEYPEVHMGGAIFSNDLWEDLHRPKSEMLNEYYQFVPLTKEDLYS